MQQIIITTTHHPYTKANHRNNVNEHHLYTKTHHRNDDIGVHPYTKAEQPQYSTSLVHESIAGHDISHHQYNDT